MTENLTKTTFLEKVFNYEKNKDWVYEGKLPAIIDFYADWCGPCKMIAPILEENADEKGDAIKILKLNVDDAPAIARRFEVMSIPTMILFKNGVPAATQVGAAPKGKLVDWINASI